MASKVRFGLLNKIGKPLINFEEVREVTILWVKKDGEVRGLDFPTNHARSQINHARSQIIYIKRARSHYHLTFEVKCVWQGHENIGEV